MALGLIIGQLDRGDTAIYTANFDTLQSMQHAVRGLIEFVPTDESVSMIVNDEGRILGMPQNAAADMILERVDRYGLLSAGQVLVGDCIVFGPPDGEGELTDVPQFILDMVKL